MGFDLGRVLLVPVGPGGLVGRGQARVDALDVQVEHIDGGATRVEPRACRRAAAQ
ncbi:hypothetical protein ACU61A_01285 [Pseudonocardia sichuanensis]